MDQIDVNRPVTRRSALKAIGAMTAATVAGVGVVGAPSPALAADEYDTLRQRWIDKVLIGTGYNPAIEPYASQLALIGTTAANYRSTMAPASSSLWPDLPIGSSRGSANVTATYTRLKWLAQGWAFPGTGLSGNSGLLAELITGLDWMQAHAYSPTIASYGNWWDWQIGSPQPLLDVMTLIYSHLSSTQVSNYLASVDYHVPNSLVASYTGTSTQANRVSLCHVLILRGVVGKSSAKIITGRNALSPVFPLVRDGDGFYADGSFIQHTYVPYIGSYGMVLLNSLGGVLALLAGSTWEVTDSNHLILFDAVTSGVAPFLFNGLTMPGQSGRAISVGLSADDPAQIQRDEHTRGHSMISALLLLAEATSPSQTALWKAMAKGWMQRDYYSPFLDDRTLSIPALARGQAVLTDGSITAAGEPTASRVFGSMDRATHRRPGWALAVAMCSARTTFYETVVETGRGENLRGWHTNSGMTYWWGGSFGNGQYSDAYWPTVDPYRLPGTTVSRKPLTDGQGGNWGSPRPNATWVGGATDGTYSALGQDTRGLSSTLQAFKSWFCLGDQVVCLGAGITASDGYIVETTIDNRNLGSAGTHAFSVDGVAQPTTLGWSAAFTGASWAAIAGFGGYVFPGGATIKALREARTGAWRDINTGGSTTPMTKRYLTLWADHGVNPTAASYAYILLPGATSTTTAARAASPTVTILSNTVSVQAISDTATGVTAANFLTAGTIGPITVTAPCSVIMRESGGTLRIAVANPTQATARITVTINRTGYSTASGDPQVNVIGLNPITLLVEAGGGQGASRVITFGTGATVTPGTSETLYPTADAYVRDGSYATTNYGTDDALIVKKTTASGYSRRAYLKFDLSGLSATPRRAVLWVSGNTSDEDGTQTNLATHAVDTDSWTETGLTWNNQPTPGDILSSAAIGKRVDWIPFDITSHIKEQYTGDKTASVALLEPNAGFAVILNSRNHTSRQPFLEVITD